MVGNLGRICLQMASWYEKHHQKGPEFNVGDLVMLDRRNIQIKQPMNKLDDKKMWPF
jgi:hypothetical protein